MVLKMTITYVDNILFFQSLNDLQELFYDKISVFST